MIKKSILTLALIMLIIIPASADIASQELLTYNFDGNVYDASGDPMTGVEVVSWINGTERGSFTTENRGPGYESYYFIDVQGDTGELGEEISFTIDGTPAVETHEFYACDGCQGDEDDFDLHLQGSVTTTTSTTTTHGGGGSKKKLRLYSDGTCAGYPVEVKVLSKSFNPLSNSEIDIFLDGKKVAYGFTDSDGIFEFIPDEPGEYDIVGDRENYQKKEISMYIPPCIETCDDGIQNQDETDVDCGGTICDPCEDDRRCDEDEDCISEYCYNGICKDPTCHDGIQNQDETDVDCGGTICDPCEIGEHCLLGRDCISENCFLEMCIESCSVCSNCHDGLKNQGERDVDCGGPCDPCPDNKSCLVDEDCQSDYCFLNNCITPTCDDGIQNNGEEGTDCGGPCDACSPLLSGITGYLIAFPGELSGKIPSWLLLLLLILLTIGLSYKRGVEKGKQEQMDDKLVAGALNRRAGIDND